MDSPIKRTESGTSASSEVIQLRLYIAGNSPNSVRALANLRSICEEQLAKDSWRLDVVDILAYPLQAVADKILVTPTLLRLTPPLVRIIGDLSERQIVLDALNIPLQKK